MNAKSPTVEEITGSANFQMLHKLHYDSIIEFVFRYIKKKTIGSGIYFFSLFILLILIIVFTVRAFSVFDIALSQYFKAVLFGFILGSFIVIPLHEIFHAVAYRIIGARPRFGMDLKQLIFYITADKFVVNRKEFHWIAMAPFAIINIAIASIFNFLSIDNQIMALFFLFFHNLMCIGDFAMLSFYHQHHEKKLFSFDIIEEKTSYMYEYTKHNN